MALSGILTVQNGPQMWHEIDVGAVTREKPAFVIGSDPRAHLRLEDAGVGRSHAAITAVNGEYRIRPTLPTMPVYINGRLVERGQPLQIGDVIRIGQTELHFNLAERTYPETQTAIVRSAPAPAVYRQPALAAAGAGSVAQPRIYYPAVREERAIVGGGLHPLTMLVGVASIVGVIGVLAYAMIFAAGGGDLGALISGREAIVYSRDAVTLVMFDADW